MSTHVQTLPIADLVAAAVRRHGAARTADVVGLSCVATANLAAGGRCRKGTLLAAESRRTDLEALLGGLAA